MHPICAILPAAFVYFPDSLNAVSVISLLCSANSCSFVPLKGRLFGQPKCSILNTSALCPTGESPTEKATAAEAPARAGFFGQYERPVHAPASSSISPVVKPPSPHRSASSGFFGQSAAPPSKYHQSMLPKHSLLKGMKLMHAVLHMVYPAKSHCDKLVSPRVNFSVLMFVRTISAGSTLWSALQMRAQL